MQTDKSEVQGPREQGTGGMAAVGAVCRRSPDFRRLVLLRAMGLRLTFRSGGDTAAGAHEQPDRTAWRQNNTVRLLRLGGVDASLLMHRQHGRARMCSRLYVW